MRASNRKQIATSVPLQPAKGVLIIFVQAHILLRENSYIYKISNLSVLFTSAINGYILSIKSIRSNIIGCKMTCDAISFICNFISK